MAKGDSGAAQNQVNQGYTENQPNINRLRNQGQDWTNQIWQRYNQSADQSQNDYADIQNSYRSARDNASSNYGPEYAAYQNFANGSQGGASFDSSAMNRAIQGFDEFSKTGGYSDQNIQDIRARSVSPIRSAYANAQAEISRQRALNGGYSPNATAALASMARDQGQAGADALTNTNANIAQMVQQGRLSGLTGEASTGAQLAGAQLQASQIGNQSRLAGIGGMSDLAKQRIADMMNANHGMVEAYSATPGQTAMYGQQMGNALNNQTANQGLSNQLAQILINGRIGAAKIPGDFQQGMGNLGSLFNMFGSAGSAANAFAGKGGNTGINGGQSSYYPDGYGPNGYIPQSPTGSVDTSSTYGGYPYGGGGYGDQGPQDPNNPPPPYGDPYGTGDWWSQGD